MQPPLFQRHHALAIDDGCGRAGFSFASADASARRQHRRSLQKGGKQHPTDWERLMILRLAIVTPVFNDWVSFQRLAGDLADCLRDQGWSVEIIVVDDCSSERPPPAIKL